MLTKNPKFLLTVLRTPSTSHTMKHYDHTSNFLVHITDMNIGTQRQTLNKSYKMSAMMSVTCVINLTKCEVTKTKSSLFCFNKTIYVPHAICRMYHTVAPLTVPWTAPFSTLWHL